jgi:hypothetical protein
VAYNVRVRSRLRPVAAVVAGTPASAVSPAVLFKKLRRVVSESLIDGVSCSGLRIRIYEQSSDK